MTDIPTAAAEPAAPTAAGDSRSDLHQFVIFHSAGEMFAVPLGQVKEIIRVPDVVRMPLSPPALLGLANLRGSVLPVLDLRHLFGLPPAETDDASRVVVLDHGHPVGMLVDRVANVVTVDRERLEPVTQVQATIDTELLTGMIKDEDGRGIVMVLDVARSIGRTFAAAARGINLAEAAGPGAVAIADAAEEHLADEDQLVSFEVDGQEYAFPIGEVQEIVQLPAAITQVPGTPGHVLGVTTLRNRLLPLVSLRTMFDLPSEAFTEANKVVVVSLPGSGDQDGAALSVGVVMDRVKAVLRVDRALVEPVPAALQPPGGTSDIRAICRLDDGRRLVSVLSADAMFDASDLHTLRTVQGESAADADLAEGDQTMSETHEDAQYVIFRLTGEEYGVPVESVQEIVRVPDQLTHVPGTPDYVEGVINLRGTVLPVIDQRRRFGLEEAARSDRQRIMVFLIDGRLVGFIVDSVSEVGRIPEATISPAPELSGSRARVVRGVANLTAQGRMIQLLAVDGLIDSDADQLLPDDLPRIAA
ncbi:chemotaxis protein CheW [Sphingomonas sp. RIT328]|uniref:chemotaxis protein CheW n=1 Tax=Sphingomonas sp. RIT328 TaxID=1470591 RepID=UPI0004485689|nr:chemotaxis protein CheW [Sphingomonas sp. RIT328]EZP48650.1 CheW-like domain protein [Sphingomonas sp. RIT328]